MKRGSMTVVVVGALLALAGSASALDWSACLQYLYPTADPRTSWEITDEGDGKGPHITKWNLPGPAPTQAQVAAVETLATAWVAEKRKLALADFDEWDLTELRLLVKALLGEVNILRKKAGLKPLTVDDIKGRLLEQADRE
jgi:hypothetical protein